jgi:hypothetical protein
MMSSSLWVWTATLAVACVSVAVEDPATSAPASQPAPAAESTATGGWVLSPSAYPKGVERETDHLALIRVQREALLARAATATEAPQVVEFNLAAANLILAQELEPFASRALLGLGQPEDAPAARATLGAARACLASAAGALEGWTDGDPKDVTPYRDWHETLDAFATALETVWPAEGNAAAPAERRGTVALAALLEHDRRDVAAAALLWQAVLYRLTDRADRALELLPRATDRVERAAAAYDFQARLLRCRLLADRGDRAAACALLLQVEERVPDWFRDDEARAEALNGVTLVRTQILEQWRAALDPTGAAAERAWCDRALARIRQTRGEAAPAPVPRLGQTIPLLTPVADELPPAATSRANDD